MPNRNEARAGSRPARTSEVDRVLTRITSNAKATGALDYAIAGWEGTGRIGYVLEVKQSAIAIDVDGITLGLYQNRRNAFRAARENDMGERPFADTP
jgi:hypothetical protein